MKKICLITCCLFASVVLFGQKIDVYQRPVQHEPDRDFDAIHYCIRLDVNMDEKKLTGSNTITLVPLRNDLNEVVLDAVSLVVTDVFYAKGYPLSFKQTKDKLHVLLNRPHSNSDTIKLTVSYFLTEQVKGLRFIDATENSPLQVSSDCYPNKAHQWIPCYDYPHDKVTQDVIVTVDKKYKVLSNGLLLGIADDKLDAGKHTYHWKQSLPHSTYLINLSIADYAIIQDSLGALPVNYWIYHSNVEDAKRSFAKTPYMIDFFNKLYQYEFPWEKYDQVISAYIGGGAEATSATLLGEAAVTNPNAEIDFSFEGIIAHEIAHQWWGDLITCSSWEHNWMHESFATYSDYLYKRYAWGEDEAEYDLLRKRKAYLREAHDKYMRPIVFNQYEDPDQNFDSHAYPKGANVLHMLRYILGDDTFFNVLSAFLHRHEFQPVTTQDFMKCVKDISGKNMDWFFEQFLFHSGHAVFEISKTWNEASKTLSLKVVQTQDQWKNVPVYKLPVEIGLYTANKKTIQKVWLEKKTETFEFSLESEPLMVRFDEGNHLLKEWTFKNTEDELLYQLKNDDVEGRLWVMDELKAYRNSPKTLETWAKFAIDDAFWAVRVAAIANLNEFAGKNSVDLFIKATGDTNSKVRAEAIKALAELHDQSMVNRFVEIFKSDKSYLVRSEALKAIGKNGNKTHLGFLKEASKIKSPRNIVSNAANESVSLILKQ